PTSRYAEPFLRRLAREDQRAPLFVVHGKGSFGRQVVDGAERMARQLGIDAHRLGPENDLQPDGSWPAWDLFVAGSFEEDVQAVTRAQALPHPPRTVCAVAAGVQEFGDKVDDSDGVFGVGQWFPGSGPTAQVGPSEAEFLIAYAKLAGVTPDYPAVQAAATATLVAHCARHAGGVGRGLLWSAAAELDTETLFGGFKIDPATGVQTKHQTVLARWTPTGLAAVPN
ncbi:MAG: ABC transporter substrate-binding protein, partial [Nitriliruptorales bacterium]|nr:ABC transporter substrate-binding protein [Nitriliruptorales bacterium]